MLQDLLTGNGSVETGVVVYLLGDILNDFNSTDMEDQEQLFEATIIIAMHECSYFYYVN